MVEELVRLSDENKTLSKLNEIFVMEIKSHSKENIKEAEVIFLEDHEDPNDDELIGSYLKKNYEAENVDGEANVDANPVEEEVEEIAEVIEPMIGDDMDDDDVIEFYLQQKLNRAQRTSPMSETINSKPAEPLKCKMCSFKANSIQSLGKHVEEKHSIKCDKCNFSTGTELQLKMHQEAHHKSTTNNEETPKIACQECDFVAKNKTQLDKHKVVRHGPKSGICWFWQSGFCARPSCKFEHPVPENGFDRRYPVPCRYGNFCRNPFCTFDHGNSFLGRRPMGY